MWTLIDTPDDNNSATDTLSSRLPEFDREKIFGPEHCVNDRKTVWKSLGQGMLALALGAALVTQIAFRHVDALAANAELRPWLQSVCAATGCVLPSRNDARLFQSERLSVTSHPDYANVLSIEVDIKNTARFAQPLPLLAVEFTDIRGNPVATRHFLPGDYLAMPDTAMSPPSHMAAAQLLGAQLAVADPGPDAVNYRVQFFYE